MKLHMYVCMYVLFMGQKKNVLKRSALLPSLLRATDKGGGLYFRVQQKADAGRTEIASSPHFFFFFFFSDAGGRVA